MVTRVESPAGWVESMNSGSKASSTTSTGTSGRSPLPQPPVYPVMSTASPRGRDSHHSFGRLQRRLLAHPKEVPCGTC